MGILAAAVLWVSGFWRLGFGVLGFERGHGELHVRPNEDGENGAVVGLRGSAWWGLMLLRAFRRWRQVELLCVY